MCRFRFGGFDISRLKTRNAIRPVRWSEGRSAPGIVKMQFVPEGPGGYGHVGRCCRQLSGDLEAIPGGEPRGHHGSERGQFKIVLYFLCLTLLSLTYFSPMKESKLGRKFSTTMAILIVGSTILNHYVHDHDLKWVLLANEGLLLGVWIGVAGYDWVQRRE